MCGHTVVRHREKDIKVFIPQGVQLPRLMAGKKSMMNAIKRAVSPNLQRRNLNSTSLAGFSAPPQVSSTPLTDFICSSLQGERLQLFGLMFAEAIKNDRHAKVIVFENVYKFLGYDRYNNAVRQLKNSFKDSELVVDNLLIGEQVSKGAAGPSKTMYLISVRQFETLMLNAQTTEGAVARQMMLDVKDAVQDYIKLEMETSAKLARQQLEEQMSRLELKDRRLKELDDVLQTERSQRERMAAQREADDEPRQTLYLYRSRQFIKIGETETDARKRGRALQTGNPEELELLLEAKCIDSKRVEGNLHLIFRWHKRRGEWYDVPAETATYFARLIINILDGARKTDFQERPAQEACQELLDDLGLIVTGGEEDEMNAPVKLPVNDPFAGFWLDCTEPETDPHKTTNITSVVPVFRSWLRDNHDPKMSSEDMKCYIKRHWKEVKTTYLEKGNILPLRGLVGRRLKSPYVAA